MAAPTPTRRLSVVGQTFEGVRLRLAFAIAKKLYVCPSCRSPIGVGAEHTFVEYLDADPPFDHEHWHNVCAQDRLLRILASSRSVPAARPPRPRRRGRR